MSVSDGGYEAKQEPIADASSSGYGLGVMRGRARAARLELAIELDPAGSRILVRAPLDARSADREETVA